MTTQVKHEVLCHECRGVFLVDAITWDQTVRDVNDHMLERHLNIIGTPEADAILFVDLDAAARQPAWPWPTMSWALTPSR